MDKTQQLMVFAIDDKLRTITMPNNGSVFGVSGDIEVNQVEFQMPRYCAGFDMTDFTGRVNYVNPNGDSNYYESEISGTDDTVSFIWLMKPDVTRYSGDVKFSVKLYKKQDGKILKQFNTRSAVGRVLEGFDVIDSVTPEEQALSPPTGHRLRKIHSPKEPFILTPYSRTIFRLRKIPNMYMVYPLKTNFRLIKYDISILTEHI